MKEYEWFFFLGTKKPKKPCDDELQKILQSCILERKYLGKLDSSLPEYKEIMPGMPGQPTLEGHC